MEPCEVGNLPFDLNFDLWQKNEVFYHSSKEHPNVNTTEKIGSKLLEKMDNPALQILQRRSIEADD